MKNNGCNSESLHKGHRQRMRQRFAANSARVFDTYELLEMLLFNAVAYKDTNPMAKMLFRRFGDIDSIFKASKEELTEVSGVGEAIADFLLAVAQLTSPEALSCEDTAEYYDDYDKTGELVISFLENNSKTEKAVAVFLFDNSMRFIGAKQLYDVDYSSGAVKADSFIDYALGNRAVVAISAHTHLYGPHFPSAGDMETNKMITNALGEAGVFHIEHYLICGKKYLGVMNHLASAFSQSPEISRFLESKARCRR